MKNNPIVSREEWFESRKRHLQKEKELTRLRDELSAERRTLPWVRHHDRYGADPVESSAAHKLPDEETA